MNIGELTVRECMREALTVPEDETTRAVFDLMSSNGARPVVVLNDAGAPIGIVTEGDLLRRILAIEIPSGGHLRQIVGSLEAALRHVAERRRAHGNHVTDVMSSPLIAVAPGDSVMIAAQLFEEHRIHQLPVLADGRLVGIIQLHDLARYVLEQQDTWAQDLIGDDEPPGDAQAAAER